MKKYLLIFIYFLIPSVLSAQLTGNGTYTSPWSGTLDHDMVWSGIKYINGDITIDNETLTISPGAIIIFIAENADLIITGTGCLEALGSPGNMITFTSDDDNDGNYGETGERWGHIYFNAPSESIPSVIDYCIIEYGDVHAFTDYKGYGGAIHTNFSNLIISNSILRNNYAYWGGAIFVNQNKNASIKNCYIYNNKSCRAGGGIYCWNGSGSVIQNCIFDSNQCLEPSLSYYTGGGLACQTNTSTKIVNCTFVNNTSTITEGQALLLHSSPYAKVINSIFWGSSLKQIYMYNTSASNIIYSAYRGITYSSGTPVNPILLNSDNNASDGPNFAATDGSDWSIKFISPCRDAGINSYTGITIPTTDYPGNSRIYTTDIGAYEVQYSRWKTEPYDNYSWTAPGNWEQGLYPGHPNATGDIVIPSLSSSSVAPQVSSTSVSSGCYMLLEPGAKATISSITNYGTLRLKCNSSSLSSLIVDSYSGNDAEYELYLSGGGSELLEDYKWHYISSPVTSLSTDVFTAVTLDLAQYVESKPFLSLLQGWVAFDGYVYSTGLSDGPTFNTLIPSKGYNFWDNDDNTFNFSGIPNTSDFTIQLGYSGMPFMHGFNLLGNPYSSGLNWDDIVNEVYNPYPANTSKGLYFTRNNEQCSYIGGVGIPEDVTGIIPPMQGFFIKTYSTGNSITIPAASRTHDNIHARYKGQTAIPLIRIKLNEDPFYYDETVVRFDVNAKTTCDYDFDAVKMFASETKTYIYSTMEGVNYAINGQPFPESSVEIPLVVNVISDGNHTIMATQLQGLDNYNVSLIDNTTGYTANLKTTPVVTFSSAKGTFTNRFILKIADITTEVNNIINNNDNEFNIYFYNNYLNILPLSDDWSGKIGTVNVFDMAGKIRNTGKNIEFQKSSVNQIPVNLSPGLYIVEIRSGLLKYTEKIIVN